MATTVRGIAFEELEGSPRISVSEQGVTAVRTFLVPWHDWDEFVQELYGTQKSVGGGASLSPGVPFPGNRTNLLVDSVEIEPFDPSNPGGTAVTTLTSGINSYVGGARVTATYRTRFDNAARLTAPHVPGETYLTFASQLSGEYFTVPGRSWKWSALNKPLSDDQPPGILVPVVHHTITWHRVVHPPRSAIRAAIGKVNSAEFYGAAPGTLLYLGASEVTEFQFNEKQTVWRIEHNFSEKRNHLAGGGVVGWNHFYNREPAGGEHWQLVVAKDPPNEKPYAETSFSSLFEFGT